MGLVRRFLYVSCTIVSSIIFFAIHVLQAVYVSVGPETPVMCTKSVTVFTTAANTHICSKTDYAEMARMMIVEV